MKCLWIWRDEDGNPTDSKVTDVESDLPGHVEFNMRMVEKGYICTFDWIRELI